MPLVLFLHGFFAAGACAPAQALTEGLKGRARVISPDLPLHPGEALDLIHRLCLQHHPAAIVGNSNGAFLAQMVASRLGLPALLGNPHLEMTRFLTPRLPLPRGPHPYPRRGAALLRAAGRAAHRPLRHPVAAGSPPAPACENHPFSFATPQLFLYLCLNLQTITRK